MKKIIFIILFMSFSCYTEEPTNKQNEPELIETVQQSHTSSAEKDTYSPNALLGAKLILNGSIKSWIKLSCSTVGLAAGLSIGAHIADNNLNLAPLIAGTALAGIAAGYYTGKKINDHMDKK